MGETGEPLETPFPEEPIVSSFLARLLGRFPPEVPRFLDRGVPVRPSSGSPPPSTLDEAVVVMREILDRNVHAFWLGSVLDTEGPGYRLNHDVRGRWMGPAPKRVVTQSRVLWYLARLLPRQDPGAELQRLARHGLTFLETNLWDPRWGGFYWEVEARGVRPTMPDKHAYGQAQALFAVSEYARVTGCERATALAHRTFEVMEEHLRDREHGGYVEVRSRDWAKVPPRPHPYLGTPPDVRLANTHLHLVEGLTAYLTLTGEPLARSRLTELTEQVKVAFLRADHPSLHRELSRDWTPTPGARGHPVSYGHDVEMAHLLLAADEALGRPNATLGLARALVDHAGRFGEDRERGGFLAEGTPGRPARGRRKPGWVQAEALLAALELHRRTGETSYAATALRTLRWIARWQADWRGGDWHAEIVGRRAYGPKVGKWHGPYHHVRALLHGLDTLPPGE